MAHKDQRPFQRDNKNRCFSVSYYNTTTKSGLTIPVTWLFYSKNQVLHIVKFAGCLVIEMIKAIAKVGVKVYRTGRGFLKKLLNMLACAFRTS